jgi:asparagine synthetase B (glutamine-hydrolysing)
MTDDSYHFAGDLRPCRAKTGTVEAALNYSRRLLARMGRNKRLGVELSGGLDSSIVIEFLLRQGMPVSLIAFTSKRYEFRTERAIQSHYEQRCGSVHLIPYEESPAFSQLEEVPPHPFPVQESLFFARHRAAAKACQRLGVDILLSGEAGDQLLGFAPERCDDSGRAPAGYAYWNLAELWSHQHIHLPRGSRYVSAIALGRLPSMILQARSSSGPDHMKLWIRQKLRDYLPPMLTDYAYKAFHDGWVIDGLIAASRVIHRMSNCAYGVTRHPELEPDLMVASATRYRVLNEQERARFLARLSFVTWVYSNHRYALVGHASPHG